MSTHLAESELAAPAAANPEDHLPENFGEGLTARILFWIAISFATFQIITSFSVPLDSPFLFGIDANTVIIALLGIWTVKIAVDAIQGRAILESLLAFAAILMAFGILYGFGRSLPNQVMRNIHVAFLCLLAAGMVANHQASSRLSKTFWWTVGIVAFTAGIYQWSLYDYFVHSSGLDNIDMVFGIAAIATLLLLVWRVMGPALPIVSGIFLLFVFFGHLLPGALRQREIWPSEIIEYLAFGTEGIYGTPTQVSATYIFLFILFGSFMEKAGVIEFFNDLSMALFGAARGGPGKVCVTSSALMGTVSGSGVANVVASGQFTIPLMKHYGFKSAFAGGVEATSSMGGQILPPVMGAVAFIMAETIGVPYLEIMKAALIPALLYFGSCYWAVHLEAGKDNLRGLPRSELPNAHKEIREKWHLILPLVALVVLLFGGYTPLHAGAVGLALTTVMILGTAIVLGLRKQVFRLVLWVGLGFLAAFSLYVSALVILSIVAIMIGASMFFQGGRDTLVACREALADGARQALPVGLACALVGIVVGVMTLTGIGSIIGTWMIGIGKDSLFAALVLTMIFSLVLGMGIPTIPNYIITSSLAAPILLKLGVPEIVSHMFVFYFGIMADLTPPVALACFAAAPMSKVSGLKISIQAVRIAIPGFVVPYMAVYEPAMMLQEVPGVEGAAYWLMVAYVCVKATLAVGLWGAATVGYMSTTLPTWERIAAVVTAIVMVFSIPVAHQLAAVLGMASGAEIIWTVNGICFAAAAVILTSHILRAKREGKAIFA